LREGPWDWRWSRSGVEGEASRACERHQFAEGLQAGAAKFRWIAVASGVGLELVEIEDVAGVIGRDEQIDVEVNEAERGAIEVDWEVDVAVEATERAVWGSEAKDAVPTVGPVELGAECTLWDVADERVSDRLLEDGIERDERAGALAQGGGPTTVGLAIVFERADGDGVHESDGGPTSWRKRSSRLVARMSARRSV